MNKPRKLNGTLLGLLGAGAILGAWAVRELIPPAVKPGVENTTPRPPITVSLTEAVPALIPPIETSPDPPEATDRLAAAQLVARLPQGEKRNMLLQRLARDWGAVDFAATVTWISSLPETAEQKMAFDEACFAAAEKNPAEAIAAWESLDFKGDDHVLENLMQNWAKLDLTAAQEWVRARPPGPQRNQAVARVAFVLAQTKPPEAAALVMREIPEGPALNEAVISILHQWAKNDPAAATAWVERFPSGPLADRARQELALLRP